jgi:signal transduction histidine kinase
LEVAAAAHDLRNRLSVAGCELRQLQGRWGVDDAGISDWLAAVERSLAHTNSMLEGLLELACCQSCMRVTDGAPCVDVVALTRNLIKKSMTCVASQEVIMGPWNEVRFKCLLRALLDNAARYSPQGGAVIVIIDRLPGEVVLRVVDHGIGIPARDLPRIFEPFYRAANAECVAAGLGLGLAAARLVVEQYGGTLEATSTEGEGSTFTVRLPLPTPPTPAQLPTPRAPRGGADQAAREHARRGHGPWPC